MHPQNNNDDPVEAFLEHISSLNVKKYIPIQKSIIKVGKISFPISSYTSSINFLSKSIVGQQLSIKAANSIWLRLLELAKKENKSVIEISTADNYDLIRTCGISNAKTKALISLKRYYEDNNLTDSLLKNLTHEERSKELQNIWGIGQWTCDMASIFYFYDYDVWPLGDVGVQNGLKVMMKKKSITQEEMIRIGKHFKPYRSILSLYAWYVVDSKETV